MMELLTATFETVSNTLISFQCFVRKSEFCSLFFTLEKYTYMYEFCHLRSFSTQLLKLFQKLWSQIWQRKGNYCSCFSLLGSRVRVFAYFCLNIQASCLYLQMFCFHCPPSMGSMHPAVRLGVDYAHCPPNPCKYKYLYPHQSQHLLCRWIKTSEPRSNLMWLQLNQGKITTEQKFEGCRPTLVSKTQKRIWGVFFLQINFSFE